jgi:hypothetical protein
MLKFSLSNLSAGLTRKLRDFQEMRKIFSDRYGNLEHLITSNLSLSPCLLPRGEWGRKAGERD